MSSRASRPRPASSRSRRQRLAAGAVLATTSLLGTYLAAIRPQPTYASPKSGGSQQGQAFVSPTSSGLCAVADDTTVYDDTSLRTAIAQSNDDSVICIGASIQLSGRLNIDDTTLTLIGDDSSITLTAASGSQIMYIDLSDGVSDDTVTIADLTLTGADDTTADGGAIEAKGKMDALLLQGTNFISNAAQDGGALYSYDMDLHISDSTFDANSGWIGRYGGAIYTNGSFNANYEPEITIRESVFTNNGLQPNGTSAGGGRGGAIHLRGYTSGVLIQDSYFARNSTRWFDGNNRSGGAIFSRAYDPSGDPGLVIVGSTFRENSAYQGGAVYTGYGSGLVIRESVFDNNYAGSLGGAVHAYDRVQVTNSLFVGNDSNGSNFGSGGALYIYGYAGPGNMLRSLISESSFINNGDDTAALNGGGVYKYYGDLTVTNSLFTGNRAQTGGGLFIADEGYDDTIAYTTISGNTATGGDGGGVYAADPINLLNSVVSGNSAAQNADAELNATANIRNSLFTSAATTNNAGANAAYGDPLLAPVGNNGGPLIGDDSLHYLPTAIPAWNSPAVGLADPDLTSITETQIGTARAGNVAGSMNAAAAPTPPTPPVTYPPSAPLNVTGTAGDASATITWTAPASAGSFPITDYQAVLSPGGASCLVQAPALSCTITGLTNGTTYTATARALNGAGWGAFSAASEPFTPENPTPPVTKTIVITGTRGTVAGKPGVYADGETTGLVGATVQARVKLAGELQYRDGSTRIVQPDGTFRWQRKTGKKVYVYFIADGGEVRSNRVIIAAR